MKLEIANVVFLIILIDSPLRKCDSDFDNVRDKRTVGVFFRSFVDAFQTQRQPAPSVVSFKPPRQTFPQSLKSDIFSSSKTIFQQKQNLLKPSTTKAPDTEVIITKPPPAPSPPSAPAEPISKDPKKQTEEFPLNLPQIPPIDPFTNFIPPPGQHPLTPFKAQLFILPFQGHQGSETPFPGFGPHLFGGIPQFNYQADIYLNPPSSGVFPSSGQHPGRYSPDNRWHDVDEILSKGIQAPQDKNVEKEKIKVGSSAKLKDVELNKYEANIESQTVDFKLSEHPEAKGPLPGGGYSENGVDGLRRDGHIESYQNGFYNAFPSSPVFLQQFPTDSNFGLDPAGNIYGDSLNNFNFNIQNQGFKQLKDEDCKTVTPARSKNVPVKPQTTEAPQDRVRVTDTGVVQWRSDPTQTGHDFTPLRGVTGETKEKLQRESYEHLPDYGLFNFPGFGTDYQHQPEQNHHYSEPDYYYNNYNDNNYLQNYQHHTKIKELPNNYQKSHNPYEHPPPSPHDPHLDETEINDSHPNGYYHFKRSYIAKRHY